MKKFFIIALLPLVLSSCNPSTPKEEDTSYVTITLDANGGYISKNKVKLVKGTVYKPELFPTPTKDGYLFSYWSYPNDDLIPIEKTYTINNDATIKAQYAKKIKVSFDTDGGTSIDPVYVAKGDLYKASLFPTPTKLGFTFSNWTFLDGTSIPDVYEFSEDITLKATYTTKELTEDEKYIKNLNIVNKCDYLYSITCDDVNYDVADSYYNGDSVNQNYYKFGKAGCSAVYKNKFAGHNFDLTYSKISEFIVTVPHKEDRLASLGVSYNYVLDSSDINTTGNMLGHKLTPFLVMDGINEKGFYICCNEVPSYDTAVGRVAHTNTSKDRMNTLLVNRYLLDRATSVDDAKTLLNEKDFFTPKYINEMHYLVADSSGKSAVIEFKRRSSNEDISDIVFYELGSSQYKGIMTNFTFNDYTGDSFTYTNADSSLTPHAEGVERYNVLYDQLINKEYAVNSLDDLLELLKNVYYTKSYTIPLVDNSSTFWYSEFHYGSNTKTTEHLVKNYSYLVNNFKSYCENKTRSQRGLFYCSRHSSSYDLVNLKMKIIFEEDATKSFEASL